MTPITERGAFMAMQECLMPKRIFKIGKMRKKDGSMGDKILYRGFSTKYVYSDGSRWINVTNRESEEDINNLRKKHRLIEGIAVPCGKCHYCRLRKAYDRAKQAWADARYFTYSYFITLTYDEEHLTFMDFCGEDGTIEKVPVLRKDEIREFKEVLRDRARKRGFQNIEYMLSGEYGEKNGRPHYHMILLTDDPEIHQTLYPAERSKTGYNLYGSTALDDIWGKGLIKLSNASTACMAYTARYTLKKSYKGDKDKERKQILGYQEEFISSTPGIGKRYLQEHLTEILRKPTLQLPGTKGVSLPKYYIDWLDKNGYSQWVKNLKDENIKKQKERIEELEDKEEMYYDEFVKHQQFKVTKRQYEM